MKTLIVLNPAELFVPLVPVPVDFDVDPTAFVVRGVVISFNSSFSFLVVEARVVFLEVMVMLFPLNRFFYIIRKYLFTNLLALYPC